jgi:hypothetical protein
MNGHEFNVINLLCIFCSYSPDYYPRPKISRNGRVTTASPPHSQVHRHRHQPPSPASTHCSGKAGKHVAVGSNETQQTRPTVELHCFVSFRSISIRLLARQSASLGPVPHRLTRTPSPPIDLSRLVSFPPCRTDSRPAHACMHAWTPPACGSRGYAHTHPRAAASRAGWAADKKSQRRSQSQSLKQSVVSGVDMRGVGVDRVARKAFYSFLAFFLSSFRALLCFLW